MLAFLPEEIRVLKARLGGGACFDNYEQRRLAELGIDGNRVMLLASGERLVGIALYH